MVYISVPDESWPNRMENRELTRFEVTKVEFTADGSRVNWMETIMTTFIPHEINLTRAEAVALLRRGLNGFYYQKKKLILDLVGTEFFIHIEKCDSPFDILQ